MRKIITTLIFLAMASSASLSVATTVDEYRKEAKAFMAEGEFRTAVIQLKNLLQRAPDDGAARLLLGQSYLALGDGHGAVSEIEKARKLGLGERQWVEALARSYLLQGEPGRVLANIDVKKSFPVALRATLLALKGLALLELARESDAKKQIDAALDVDPDSSDALTAAAKLALQQQKFSSAVEKAKLAITADKTNVYAWILLGESERFNANLKGARYAFEQAVATNPHNVQAQLGYATSLVQSGKSEEAKKVIAYIRKDFGDNPLALYLLAQLQYYEEEYRLAEENLLKVLRLAPSHPTAKFLLGATYYSLNRLNSAEDYLRRYLGVFPKNNEALKMLASTYIRLDAPAKAVELFDSRPPPSDKDAQLLALYGSAYLRDNQPQKALDYLQKAAALAPTADKLQTQLAVSLLEVGKYNDAIERLTAAVDLPQDSREAETLLILTFVQQRQFENALNITKRFIEKYPSDPFPYDVAGLAYMEQGNEAEARRQWGKALSIDKQYISARLNLAKLELQKKNLKAAEQQYQSVLKHKPDSLEALTGLAGVAQYRGDHNRTLNWLKEARRKNRSSVHPIVNLAKYYLAIGDADKSLEFAREAQARSADSDEVLKVLAAAHIAKSNASDALEFVTKLIRIYPEDPQGYYLKGQALLLQSGDEKAALEQWDKALRQKRDFLPAIAAKTELLLKQGKLDKALGLALQIQKEHQGSPSGYFFEGEIRSIRRNNAKAVAAYKKAYERAQLAYIARRLAQSYRSVQDNPSAINVLKQWLSTHANDAFSWALLADSYQGDGQLNEAINAYENAHRVMPQHISIMNNLTWLYFKTGRQADALLLADKLLALGELPAGVLDTVGQVYIKSQKVDKGIGILKLAVAKDNNSVATGIHLAEALIQQDNKQGARAELKRLLAVADNSSDTKRVQALLNSIK